MDAVAITIALGHVLRRQRKVAELTQEQLGLAADLQRNYVSELERGEKQASVVTLFRLAAALGVSPQNLVAQVSLEIERATFGGKEKQS